MANKRCIVKWKTDSKWEEIQSEFTENLIEDKVTTQNEIMNLELEINTEIITNTNIYDIAQFRYIA